MNIANYISREMRQVLAFIAIVTLIFSAAQGLFVGLASANHTGPVLNTQLTAYNNPADNVTICHTGNGTNFTNPTVSADSIVSGTSGHGDRHDEDIIPAFWHILPDQETATLYHGRNWDAEGVAIWNNGGCDGVVVVDQCPNLEGNQETVPEGLIVDESGDCVEPPVDVCPNIDGVQTEIPEGLIVNGEGNCVEPPVDMCPNIEGNQEVVPQGFYVDGEGNCVEIPEDACPNIDGVQETVPEGLIVDESGDCVEPPVDVCPNLEGVQTTVPEGFYVNNDGNCVELPDDVCPNIDGVQTEIPEGLIVNGEGNCVEPPVDQCPNLDGVQTEVPEGYEKNNEGNCVMTTPKCEINIYSDLTDYVVEKDANAVAAWTHPNWSASIPGATWIWGDYQVVDASVDETQTFVKQFGFVGNVLSANLEVATDNGHSASINNNPSYVGGSSFLSAVSYDVSGDLAQGNNELSIAVTNDALGTDPEANPAGLLYRLHILAEVTTDDDCMVPYEPPVETCDDDSALNYGEEGECRYPDPVCEIGDNLLVNGSFEEPVVEHKNLWDTFASVPGWIIEKVFDDSSSELEIHRGWSGNQAADGEQYVELDANDNNHSSLRISQDVTLEEGAEYELRWAFAPRQNLGAAENALSVLVDNVEVATNSASGVGVLSASDWILGSYNFVADDTSGNFAFADDGMTENKLGTFLDNAVLCKVAEAVPGCTDREANNYNPDATVDDQSCSYEEETPGCTDPDANNYNQAATISDNSCEYTSTGGGGGGGGSTRPRCDVFTANLDDGEITLTWETRRGRDLTIDADGEEIYTEDDDDTVDEGSLTITDDGQSEFELTVFRGTRSDSCVAEIERPTPQVLGEQVSVVPQGAPDAGAGGTSPVEIPTATTLVAILGGVRSRNAK